jgi:hypothetical protein
MKNKQTDNFPTNKTLTETLPPPIIDSVGGGVTYYGNAQLGTKENEAGWKIMRVTVAGTITKSEFPDSNMNYDFKWSDRASLTYSR